MPPKAQPVRAWAAESAAHIERVHPTGSDHMRGPWLRRPDDRTPTASVPVRWLSTVVRSESQGMLADGHAGTNPVKGTYMPVEVGLGARVGAVPSASMARVISLPARGRRHGRQDDEKLDSPGLGSAHSAVGTWSPWPMLRSVA
jgi:hypothetical protein